MIDMADTLTEPHILCTDVVRIFSADGVEVQALQGLDARVELRNLSTGSDWVPGSSLSRLATTVRTVGLAASKSVKARRLRSAFLTEAPPWLYLRAANAVLRWSAVEVGPARDADCPRRGGVLGPAHAG